MSLVVFTAFVGMICAPTHLSFGASILALFAITLGAGGSGALNMWWDRDIDPFMKRTQKRALCTGEVLPFQALILGLFLSLISIIGLYMVSNFLSSFLLFFTIFFYICIYSMILKRKTPQNIVIGGAAGAFPPMIGYVAQSGSINLESLILFLIIFLWTPPHFWMLALDRIDDYATVNVPMLPNTHGKQETIKQSIIYVILLWPVTLIPVFYGIWGYFYGICAVLLNLGFTISIFKWAESAPKRVFGISIFYLFFIFLSILIDRFFQGVFA